MFTENPNLLHTKSYWVSALIQFGIVGLLQTWLVKLTDNARSYNIFKLMNHTEKKDVLVVSIGLFWFYFTPFSYSGATKSKSPFPPIQIPPFKCSN